MTVKMTSMVFDHYPNGGGEYALALALADSAHDDGTHVFPSVATLAHKSRQSERTVQRQLRAMVSYGWLQVVREGGGRLKSTQYRINPGWIADPKGFSFRPLKGDILSPFTEGKPRHSCVTLSDPETVTNDAGNGDIAVSPEQELNLKPPSIPPESQNAGCTVPSDGVADQESDDTLDRQAAEWMLAKLRVLNPKHGVPNWRRWCREIRLMRVRDKRSRREICELFRWANNDPFWQTNILSPGKLRQQWDQLVLKRSVAGKSAGAGGAAAPTSYRCVGQGDGHRCGKQGTRTIGLSNEWICEACFHAREERELAIHG